MAPGHGCRLGKRVYDIGIFRTINMFQSAGEPRIEIWDMNDFREHTKKWLKRFRLEDNVRNFARVRYYGWQNHVRQVKIENEEVCA